MFISPLCWNIAVEREVGKNRRKWKSSTFIYRHVSIFKKKKNNLYVAVECCGFERPPP